MCSNMQTPTLTRISPNPTVSPGEVLQFRCTTPSPTCISVDFSLYKTGSSVKKQTAESTTTFTLTVDASHQGQYTCDYSYREIASTSPRSNSISITVVPNKIRLGQYTCDYSYRESASTSSRSNSISITVVNLQQPNISFSAAGGPEVTRGYGFSIMCSTEPQYPGGSFHLKFSRSNITRTQSSINHSAVFLFPEADFVHQGNYSCTYEVNVSSRTFTSTTTELQEITVKASLALYIGVGVTAGLLLILVPVIICFVKTQKRRKCQMDKTKDSQRAKNTYKSPQGEIETDDEADYENAETIFQDSEDSENDYINVDADEQRNDVDNDYEDVDIYANCLA
ncbi:hypothetical protein AMELA_G00298450 [Ameiurus melas]|uniref:Ig-like domain-containing protein n=1 Tax=Ameiurus melas TaxID=219545 RepID=A0A7J5ZI03_AMEME|nr:hypothetical protein AMELA_G00298450 [Ameiurus melas]